MALNAITLLAKPNAAALKDIVQDALVEGVSADDLDIGTPVVGVGSEMVTKVSVSTEAYGRPDFEYHGSVNLRYQRLDLADTFSGIDLEFMLSFPTKASVVAGLIGTAFNIHFGIEDYIEEPIDDPSGVVNFLFKANPDSPRWMGQLPVKLFRRNPVVVT